VSPRIAYREVNFREPAREVIAHALRILAEYAAQGFDLTLRQLYYQFVARDVFPDDRWWRWIEQRRRWVRAERGEVGATKNAYPNYKWLGDIISDARYAGLIDWHSITDRTRFLQILAAWESPIASMRALASQYHEELWATQPIQIEVWIEKEGMIEDVCNRLRVPYLTCHGYPSTSEVWRAAQRIGEKLNDAKRFVLLHLGDHDPSGIDMSRDIEDRIREFLWGDRIDHYDVFEVRRIALTWKQIEQYGPPPNPAKVTDSRAAGYIARFGGDSWELDALEPAVIADLIETNVLGLRDSAAWDEASAREDANRDLLRRTSDRWDEVRDFLADA